ncbi:DUF3489 domain-containing protein [Rhodobacter capsulatus]|uniref:DUF3489 domain-containing protein n=1 Tax=Rhodobacter capsulatus TaxID=1061 RepID=A0A1G7SYZ1_RHOCA|nr:DUF3489 domain-containing protein [Rhodobacter capsulatus]WER10354.1 DUF3489 domain-containing protein [Rhodobacter capsulatus]SDG28277.1 Protein of unknown function [Rhodobacter capsulatus]
MTTPSDTQSLILSRAATRPGNLALPLPEGLVGAAAKMVVGKMIARGWLEEVEANLRRGEPMWRETGDGHGTTLIATEAGLEAIGIEPVVASAVAGLRKSEPKPELTQTPDETDTAKTVAFRAGTKQAQIIAIVQRPEGATVAEMVEATGWLAHTVRGCISGALKKKLGLPITAEKVEGRGTVHRLERSGFGSLR